MAPTSRVVCGGQRSCGISAKPGDRAQRPDEGWGLVAGPAGRGYLKPSCYYSMSYIGLNTSARLRLRNRLRVLTARSGAQHAGDGGGGLVDLGVAGLFAFGCGVLDAMPDVLVEESHAHSWSAFVTELIWVSTSMQ